MISEVKKSNLTFLFVFAIISNIKKGVFLMEFSRNMDKEDIEYVKFIMEYGDGYSPLSFTCCSLSI